MINIAWMYPDILNLHGERANAKAFELVGKKLGVEVNIDRIDDLASKVNFDKYDILLFNPGELKTIKEVAEVLKKNSSLKKYIKNNKVIFVTGTSGVLFGNTITRLDGTTFKGLNIVDVDATERNMVIGDDIYYKIDDMEIMGSQIHMVDIDIKNETPFTNTIYGYGNNGTNVEGYKKNNLIFTNALGPVLVKNPWLCEYLLDLVIKNNNLKVKKNKVDYDLEYKSLESAKEFINKKINNNENN